MAESSLVERMQEFIEAAYRQILADKTALDYLHERYKIGDQTMKASTESAFGRRLIQEGMELAYDWGADEVRQACVRLLDKLDQPAFLRPHLEALEKSAKALANLISQQN